MPAIAQASALAICVTLSSLAADPPQAVVRSTFGEIAPLSATPRDTSAVFVSEDTLALLIRYGPGMSDIRVVRLEQKGLRAVALATTFDGIDEVFAVSRQRLVLSGLRHKYLYSADLKQRWDVPFRLLSDMFPRGGVWASSARTGGLFTKPGLSSR